MSEVFFFCVFFFFFLPFAVNTELRQEGAIKEKE